MTKLSDNAADGLIEAVGQELKPCQGASNDTIKINGGQWSFRFEPTAPDKISVNVSLVFGAPFSLTSELCCRWIQRKLNL